MHKAKKNSLAVAIAAAMLMPVALPVQAVDWTGQNSSDWFVEGNWNPVGVPGAVDDVVIDTETNVAVIQGAEANVRGIVIGNQAAGALTITGGGILNGQASEVAVIGVQAGSSGVVNVDGANGGATWNVAPTAKLLVGDAGRGNLTIVNGGVVNASAVEIGFGAGSIGEARIAGAGSSLNVGSQLFVGTFGKGSLTVSDSAVVSSAFLVIGADDEGTATVENGGSLVSGVDGLIVGGFDPDGPDGPDVNIGKGMLIARNGGEIFSGSGKLGATAGSVGEVAIGAGSRWTATRFLFVGAFGEGRLVIEGGGQMNVNAEDAGDGSAFLGANRGATGTATVDGAGSVWTVAGTLFVGGADEQDSGEEGGTGHLTVRNGGRVDSGNSTIAATASSLGTVVVDGQGSIWTNAGNLDIGDDGAGTLEIGDFGAVEVAGASAIGIAAGSHGVATIGSGARLSAGDLLFVARQGVGEMKIDGGGRVLSGFAIVGEQAGSTGTATVTGAGSGWLVAQDTIKVGHGGTGTLQVADQGHVQSAKMAIGDFAGSVGTVTVTDAGSVLDSGTLLTVGNEGVGNIAVRNGGVINVNGTADVGFGPTGEGTFAVQGAGSLFAVAGGEGLFIGNGGVGRLSISDGGSVTSDGAHLGLNAGASGSATVEGANSSWTNATALFVGSSGIGTLDIGNGGRVSAESVELASSEIGAGILNVRGPGSVLTSTQNISVGFRGNGTLTLQDQGKASSPLITIAGEDTAAGVLNIGAAEGEAATAAGIVDAPVVSFGDGAGEINLNHTDTDYAFAAAISGAGTVNVLSGTTALTAANTYTGATHVSGGKLLVEGSLDGSAVTVTGGALGGRGSIAGQVSIAAGGTIAPGASIGTLTLNGDYVQNAGSTYEAEIDAAGNPDRIAVSGTAQLAGAVTVLGETALNASYTLLTAGSGISGQYDTLNNTAITPFLNFTLRYDPNAVFLDVTRSALTFASLGATRNQIATGAALDRLPVSSPLLGDVVGLDQPTALDALDRLSGEIHASTRGALLEDGRFVRDTANQRLRATQNHGERSGWIQAYGNSGSIDRDGNATETDIGSGGVLIGADMAVGDARLGVMGGTGRISVQADERQSKANSDSLYFGAYAGTHWGAWDLRAGLAYGRHDVETERKVAFGDLNEMLRADYDVETAQAFVEAAYRIDTENSSFEPYLNLAAVKAKNDGYQENGGIAALRGGAEDTDTGLATLGLRAAAQLKFGAMPARLHGSLGWRHAFGDTLPLSHHAFAGGDAFAIAGAPIAGDAAVASARLDLQLSERAVLGLGYSGLLGDDSRENSVQAQLQVKF